MERKKRRGNPPPIDNEIHELVFLPGVDTLSQEQMVSTAQRLVNGEIIDFSSAHPLRSFSQSHTRQMKEFDSVRATMFREPGTKSEGAFFILAKDLSRLSLEQSLSDDQRLTEWAIKLGIGIHLSPMIALQASTAEGAKYKEANRYYKAVRSQTDKLRKVLAGFKIDHLSSYIRFQDILHTLGFYNIFGVFFHPINENSINLYKGRLISEVLRIIKEDENELKEKCVAQDEDTWNRLKHGWKEKQIEEVVSLLPKINQQVVRKHSIFALEQNIFSLSAQADEKKRNLMLDPKGMAVLLGWKWAELTADNNGNFPETLDDYGEVGPQLESNSKLFGTSIPRKYLPTTAISLLLEAGRRNNGPSFEKLITDIDNLATSDKDIAAPWLISLLAIKADNPQFGDFIDNIVDASENIQQIAKDIFLNRQSGKIWLTRDSKLRTTNGKTQLTNAFLVYVSSKEEEIAFLEYQPAQSIQETQQKKKIEAKEILLMPFFGEVGQAPDSGVAELISQMFNKESLPDEEYLLDEYARLANALRDKSSNARNKEPLYISDLNNSGHALEAKKVDIEALYLKEGEAIFVLSQDFGLTKFADREFKIGLKAKIDEAGQLLVTGMDDSFVGEKEQLFLNTLALRVLIQPLFNGTGSVPSGPNRDVIREINSKASAWNRSPARGSLPKIGRATSNPYILMNISGYKESVLVGEI